MTDRHAFDDRAPIDVGRLHPSLPEKLVSADNALGLLELGAMHARNTFVCERHPVTEDHGARMRRSDRPRVSTGYIGSHRWESGSVKPFEGSYHVRRQLDGG